MIWLVAAAYAGSLDLIELGGFWGSPVTTEPTAISWNPGGLGFQHGTRFFLEGAPIVASVRFDRDDPDYGGPASFRLFSVAPYGALVTDAGVKGLGFGIGASVPIARGAKAVEPDGPARTHLRTADIKAIQIPVGVGYAWKDKVGFGASVSYILGTWAANLDQSVAPDLYDQLVQQPTADLSPYDDPSIVENPRYLTNVNFGPLIAHNVTFALGVHAKPLPWLEVAASYQHGWTARHKGTAALQFDCPPTSDSFGRLGAEDRLLCDAPMAANAGVAYKYPARIRYGVAFTPDPAARVEVFGTYNLWRTFRDFDITLDDVHRTDDVTLTPETAELVGKDRQWARDNRDNWTLGVDAKYQLLSKYRIGVRAVFDSAAVPDATLSPNNYDANTLVIGGMFGYSPMRELEIGLGYSEALAFQRTTASSAFGQVVDPAQRNDQRYFYPAMAGTYNSAIHRFSISLKGAFDGSRKDAKRRSRDALEPEVTPDPTVEEPR